MGYGADCDDDQHCPTGTADSILGEGEEADVLQLTLNPDDAPPAPDEEEARGILGGLR